MDHASAHDTSHCFPQRMRLRVPLGLADAVKHAARQEHTSGAEWVRRALLGALRDRGLCLLPDGRVEGRAAPGGPT
jgi:hypothetical protein